MKAIKSILDTIESGAGGGGGSASPTMNSYPNSSGIGGGTLNVIGSSAQPLNSQYNSMTAIQNLAQMKRPDRQSLMSNTEQGSHNFAIDSGLLNNGTSQVGEGSGSLIMRNTIELKDGKSKREKLVGNQSNIIRYHKYYGVKGLWYFFADTLANFDNVFAVIFLIFHFYVDDEIELTPYFSLILLLINILVQGVIHFISDLKIKHACQKLNERQIQKFVTSKRSTSKGFELRSWASLKPGDIIKVREDEEFPADVLILDSISSLNDHKCYVIGGYNDDFSVPTLKRACEGTYNRHGMKMSSTKFVEQISGTVKYEYNFLGYFNGNFRHNNHPAPFNLSMENVVVKGSRLCLTKSVIALVLNVESHAIGSTLNQLHYGKNSKQIADGRSILRNSIFLYQIFPTLRRPDYQRLFYHSMRILQTFLFLLYLAISIIIFFQVKLSKTMQVHKFSKTFVELFKGEEISNLQMDEVTIYFRQVLAFTCGLLISIPNNFKIMLDLIVMMHANFLEWDYNCVPAELKVNNGYVMMILGNVQNIFLTPNALISQNNKNAKVLQIGPQWYFNQEHRQGEKNDAQKVEKMKVTSISPNEEAKKNKNFDEKRSIFKNYQYPFRNSNSGSGEIPQAKSDNKGDSSSFESPQDLSHKNRISKSRPAVYHNDDQMETQANQSTTQEDYLPNDYSLKNYFNNKKLQNEIHNGKSSDEIRQLLRAMVLCHQANKTQDLHGQNTYKSLSIEDEALLMVANSFGYHFLAKHNKSLSISFSNSEGNLTRTGFSLVVNHCFNFMTMPVTVTVIKSSSTPQAPCSATIYAKGSMSAIFNFIDQQNEEQKHNFLKDLKHYAEMGLSPTMYIKRELSIEDEMDLEAKINEAMSLMKGQDDKIESCLLTYMHDMSVLGTVGLQDVFNTRDTLVVQDLMRNGIKVWMLSTEDEIQMVVNCNSMNLLNKDSNPLIINGETEREVEEQVKKCFSTILDDPDKKQTEAEDKRNASSTKALTQRILMVSGHSLHYILKEDHLNKRFLTLASFCELIIGSNVGCTQKCELLKGIKVFNQDNRNVNTMSIICSQKDQAMANHADISIALATKNQLMTTLQIKTDIVMNSIYTLPYILFKHGTFCNRRIHEVTKLIIYRTFFIALVYLVFMNINGFSASLPVKRMMIIMFFVIVSPIQILFYGFSFRDVGYKYLYRIYGEYKRNFLVSLFNRYDILQMLMLALLDTFVFYMMSIYQEVIVQPQSGMPFNLQGVQLFQGVALHIIFTFQLTNQNEVIQFYQFGQIFINILGILFILDDEYLLGIKQLTNSPIALLYLLFVIFYCLLRNFVCDFLRKLVLEIPSQQFEYYSEVEDLLFLEEYEDPDQEFDLRFLEKDYKEIERKLDQKNINIINQNLMRLPRSDEIEQIITKINQHSTGMSIKRFQDQSVLQWFSLKFNDQNKEIEYIEQSMHDKIFIIRKIVLITLVFNILEIIKEIILRSTGLITLQSFWFFFGFIIIACVTLLLTYKYQSFLYTANLCFLIFLCVFYSFCYFYIDNIEFSLFLTISIYVFSMHGTYLRLIYLLMLGFISMTLSLLNSNFAIQIGKGMLMTWLELEPSVSMPFISTIWGVYIISLALILYWMEKESRLEFWQTSKKVKEFQKLKSILHILMPDLVRERIRQGQRFIADDQGEVTILFCDIAEFDTIVQMFTGKELCEWLDNIYQSFDQLCEKHGLQKIETVGKTYMACGGLKQSEKKIDQRLLNRHHSVRVADFSMNILNFISKQKLKDGSPVKVKIGIHTGKVISGVVGENKPQFSLVGDTVNKTSRVCSKCLDNQILISKETYALLESYSNLFSYQKHKVEMKGIGKEYVFYIRKKSNPQIMPSQQDTQRLNQNARIGPSSFSKGSGKKIINKSEIDSQTNRGASRLNRIAPQLEEKSDNQENYRLDLNIQQPDTSRSLIYSDKNSGIAEPNDHANDSNDESEFKEGEESFNIDYNRMHHQFGEFKDDKAIIKNPVVNSQYQLIERPNYLMSFSQNNSIEEKFRFQMIKEDQWRKIFYLIATAVFNKLTIAYYYLESTKSISDGSPLSIFLYVYVGILLLLELTIFIRVKLIKLETTRMMTYLLSIYFIIMLGATTAQCWSIPHQSRLIQIYLCEIIVTLSLLHFLQMLQLRKLLFINLVTLAFWIAIIVGNRNIMCVKTYSFTLELLYIIAILTVRSYLKEMAKRKGHNRKIILEFEIKRTNDLLNNLVPPPVLQGIKNDQKVVDELEDVTLLFTDMVGFTQFSNNVKNPKEVVKLLSELFTRFDQLCVQNKVYKVHTIGDCYVILGYTGHIPQSQRTLQIKAEEAYRVVRTGFEMIDIISEVRNHPDNKSNPDLKDLNMRIGIHTGKIVAGIIGTNIVRYDIFGGDVLVANKMESNGVAGRVVVSEDTKRLLQSSTHEIANMFDFNEHKTVELQGINRQVESYLVETRDNGTIGSNSSISGEDQQEVLSDDDEEQEEVKENNYGTQNTLI